MGSYLAIKALARLKFYPPPPPLVKMLQVTRTLAVAENYAHAWIFPTFHNEHSYNTAYCVGMAQVIPLLVQLKYF